MAGKISVKNVKRRRMYAGFLMVISVFPALVLLLAPVLALNLIFSEVFVIAAIGMVVGGVPLFGILTYHYNRTVRRANVQRVSKGKKS